MYRIFFSWGYDGQTGEKYLDTFYICDLDKLQKEAVQDLLNGGLEFKGYIQEVQRTVALMNIRVKHQNTKPVYFIDTEDEISREDFEMWIKYTPDKELEKKCKKL